MMSSMNIKTNESLQEINQLKGIIARLEEEKQELINRMMENNMETDRIVQLKEQIASEFESLTRKNEEVDNKLSQLNLRETEIIKKEAEIKQLIVNYDYLFKTNQIQMEITNSNNLSSYIWKFNKNYNVIGLKLMSYSLPIPRFNIMGKNNKLSLKVNDDEINVEIPFGKYVIEDLVSALNKKLQEKDESLSISLNFEQHVILESSDTTKMITIIPNYLSQYNLGFTENKPMNKHTSTNTWDLRLDDKVYLFINNVSDEVPLGALYFNGMSTSQFKFESPYNLDSLEIIFRDSRGNLYDFYNLPHTLNILLDVYN